MNHNTFNLQKRLLLAALLGFLACLQAHAQVSVHLKMDKKNYLIGEPISATLSITNNAGRQITLTGNSISSWLNFQLSRGGRAVPPARKINYKPTVIPIGQTVGRKVVISTSHALGTVGNYTVSASVRMPGTTLNGFTSNRSHFTIARGRNIWTQYGGLPSSPDQIREYKLITFTGNNGLDLYADISDKKTGRRISTIPLGKILSFNNPTATLDRSNNMHALYQLKPDLFAHCSISPHGKVVSAAYHKRGKVGTPRLITFGNGNVRVGGTVPYDPKVEAAERAKVRKISERPPFLYK